MRQRLCALDEIPDGGCKGFGDGTASSLFAVRRGDRAFVYRNRCPHAGAPLNWMPDRFLNRDKTLIICTAHGALFRIESGECVAGPCAGDSLQGIPCEIRDGTIWIGQGCGDAEQKY